MSARQQYRLTFRDVRNPEQGGTCFIDAADEAGARLFFSKAFPNSTLVSIRLEPVDPCAAYERRGPA